jgi:nitrate/nitrite-specific signal transduction histidine kinase
MQIGQKLILGFIVVALLVAVVGAVAVVYNTDIIFDIDQMLLSNSNEAKAVANAEWVKEAISNSTGIVIISTIIGILAVVVICYFIWRIVSKPLIKLRNAADKIGKGGKAAIEVGSDDEVGAIAQSFNYMACQLEEARTSLEEKVKQRTQELLAVNTKLQEDIGSRSSVQEKSQLHIRHLDCFYGLSKLIEQPGISLEEIFQETANLIRNTFQHPDNTCVRITFEGVNYKTDNFKKSELSLYAKIKISGEEVGAVDVYYIGGEQKDGESPFLKEVIHRGGASGQNRSTQADRRKAGITSTFDRPLQ